MTDSSVGDELPSERTPSDRRRFLKQAVAGAGGAAMAVAQAADAVPTATPASAPASAAARPEPAPRAIERPGSDFMIDVIRTLDIDYVSTNPGSSFRSLHESLVNYGGNKKPELLTCLHEESAVAMAHGYAKAAGKPMGVFLHGTVGLQHAAMVRDYLKWDDAPASLQHFAESTVRAYKVALTPPMAPVLVMADIELQEEPVHDSALKIPALA